MINHASTAYFCVMHHDDKQLWNKKSTVADIIAFPNENIEEKSFLCMLNLKNGSGVSLKNGQK